jgi:hypothetical protein
MALYRGAGGVEWEIDPPREGTQAREHFDAQVKNGELVLVDAPEPDAPEPDAPEPDAPEPDAPEPEKSKRATKKAAPAVEA